MIKYKLKTALFIGASAITMVAAAQDTAESSNAESMVFETIMVTAQRREQSIQDVPVSVTAFGRDSLHRAGIDEVIDLQQVDASLNISAQSGAVIPFIRGIGNIASATPGNESSVPIYVDDAYYSRLFPPYLMFADNIERVEVLKGPQGTLFGRNATGGLIHIQTRDPGQETVFKATVGYGSQKTFNGKLYFATPLSDTLAIDFSIVGQDMGSGFGTNLFNGEDTYTKDYLTLRSKLVWTPSDETTVKLSGFYVKENSSIGTVGGGGLEGFPRGLPGDFTEAFDQPADFFDINVNFPTLRRHRGHGGTLKIDHSFGFADFSSITFYRKSKEPWTSEGDHTSVRWLEYFLPVEDKQFTQELQLKSNEESPLTWIVGLYYMDATAAIEPTSITGESIELGGMESFNLSGRQDIESKAAFAQTSIPLMENAANLTLGLRYTMDDVDGLGQQFGIFPGDPAPVYFGPDYVDSGEFNKLTYKASFDYAFSDDVMGYVSYSRGFKSGTFNLLPLDQPALNPEIVDAYEVGLKSTLAEGRFTFNVAAFWNDIKDPQVFVVKVVNGVASNLLANAQKARTLGVEFDGNAHLTSNLTARFSGQYVDAKFQEFLSAPIVTPIFDAPYGVLPGFGDVSGNQMPQVPKWRLNFGLDYEVDSDIGVFVFGANVSYRSGFPWEADNVAEEPSLTLVNAGVSLAPSALENVSVRVWAKNLTNEKYLSNLLTQTGPAGFLTSPAEPRTWGVELSYSF